MVPLLDILAAFLASRRLLDPLDIADGGDVGAIVLVRPTAKGHQTGKCDGLQDDVTFTCEWAFRFKCIPFGYFYHAHPLSPTNYHPLLA